jgi:hypothetical protein
MAYDARYWREQAALCVEIARQISDRRAADSMRATAADYFSRAAELERRRSDAGGPPSASPPAGRP